MMWRHERGSESAVLERAVLCTRYIVILSELRILAVRTTISPALRG